MEKKKTVTKHPTTIQCHIHGEVQFSSTSDLGGDIVTRFCPLCAKGMHNTVTRTCDECGNSFEVREDIAVDVDYWASQDNGYCCPDCCPNNPYAEDEPSDYEESGDLEDGIDETVERFPDGDDPMKWHLIECKCRKCDVEFEVKAGEPAWCPSCHEERNDKNVA